MTPFTKKIANAAVKEREWEFKPCLEFERTHLAVNLPKMTFKAVLLLCSGQYRQSRTG